jgi:two-component system cell cycle response regulator DivK
MAGELILLVEDNEKNRKLLRDVLRVTGYETVETTTAEEGLEIARARRPAVILMDIQLPGMDGISALRRLRIDPTTQRIPVIAVTASAMPQDRQEILAAGFDGYQTKPISVKEILAEVRKVLDTRSSPEDEPRGA